MRNITFHGRQGKNNSRQSFDLIFISALVFCTHIHATEVSPNEKSMKPSNQKWHDIAIRDIHKVREILNETHPAKLDPSQREFHDWLDSGHRQAILLAARSESMHQASAAVNFYLTGFNDTHLGTTRLPQESGDLYWAGWTMEYRNGRYLVASRSADWPVALPQIGDEVISCDGVAVQDILRNEVAPFVDRRMHLDNTLDRLARHLTAEHAYRPLWNRLRPAHCLIQPANGNLQRIPMMWKKQPSDLKIRHRTVPQQGMQQIQKGVYWINASNFMLNAEESINFESLLNDVRSIENADAIVLDTRGNNGGNSMVGSRLLSALLKNTTASHENAKAYWRISPLARKTLATHQASALQIEGKESLIHQWLGGLLESMDAAALRGESFVEQMNVSIDDEQESMQGQSPFQGKLVLITDSYCNSACLDFVDEVMAVPGVLHAGSTTDADTRYIDVGATILPSGIQLWVPLKVWVGRRRQDNVPYVPRIKYAQDLNDTEALQSWVLHAVLPLARSIGIPDTDSGDETQDPPAP